jgi:hypothetical protein
VKIPKENFYITPAYLILEDKMSEIEVFRLLDEVYQIFKEASFGNPNRKRIICIGAL